MKKQLMIIALAAIVVPGFAQTNEYRELNDGRDREKREEGEFNGERKHGERRRDMTPEQKEEVKEKRLQLMEKTLKAIGVTDEQRADIIEMQKNHKEIMREASKEVDKAREKLSKLEESGATQEEIYAAIDVVADAQADQMKMLTRGRMEMKRLLGPEKYNQFMEAARSKWRETGRRGGTGMPPIPGESPAPRRKNTRKTQESVSLPPTPEI